MSSQQQREQTVARLAEALEQYHSGQLRPEPIVDPVALEAQAPVKARALRLLEQRARSQKELRDRLLAAEFEPELVEAVLADLVRVGLIDDREFAHQWVRQRHQYRGKSRRVLERELILKGVGAADRAAALETISEDDEYEQVRQLAAKRVKSIRELPADHNEHRAQLRRLLSYLARRGYSESVAFPVAEAALTERWEQLRS